jgi:hypothetical protein
MLDRNFKPLVRGQNVRIRYCDGPYGHTRTVEGILEEMNQYGGVTIKLTSPGFSDDRGRFGMVAVKTGDSHYVANAFFWDSERKCRVGYGKHDDFEHGHEYFCEIIDSPKGKRVRILKNMKGICKAGDTGVLEGLAAGEPADGLWDVRLDKPKKVNTVPCRLGTEAEIVQ